MNALGVWGQFFSMAILGLVLWAAVSDLLFRRIPNAAVISIVLVEAAALAAAALGGNGGAALGLLQSGSVWAVGVLIAGFLLYLTGRMGAGDVKLAAVLLILLSLVGGLMVLGLPLLRMIETKTGFWAERLAEAFGRPLECTPIGLLGGEAQKGLPYGLAIAAGFAAVQFGVFSHIF
ncbi:prepilin peptidase [Sutterella wadsworthensis]|uniref:prepilin peptidase n=1 Tax=Sutterella wadsworthensis TaxID=40545 RepID=UPI00242B6834|nr:prepilin peptidase [Sutterella wadsworthensis]